MFRSGFISVVGKPNVGKSTLINTLVGQKVSIVSFRPQTTRNKILGIMNGENYQGILVDSPGVHKPKNNLSRYMMKSVSSAIDGVDIYIYVISCDKKLDDHDMSYITDFAQKGIPFYVVINKCDEAEDVQIVERINALKDIDGIDGIFPTSALKHKGTDELKKELVEALPEGVRYFDEDMYTDKNMRFIASEMIREKALKMLSDEVPYGIGVTINKFEFREDGIVDIDADIICEKQAHKAIVIGKGGQMIKKISSAARTSIENMVGCKVFLTTYVKVKEDWRDNNNLLNELGYNPKEI